MKEVQSQLNKAHILRDIYCHGPQNWIFTMRVVLNRAKSCLDDAAVLCGWVVAGRDVSGWLTSPMGLKNGSGEFSID